MNIIRMLVLILLVAPTGFARGSEKVEMPLVDTGQTATYNTGNEIS